MYVVTNRRLDEKTTGLDVFQKTPNPRGPNELRIVEITKRGSGFQVETVPDELTKQEIKELNKQYKLGLDPQDTYHASLKVACALLDEARKRNKHILFFVHGYNNDMGDVLRTAHDLQERYDVTVVPFSWPANGGGAFTGKLAYLSDKDDARVSAPALGRFIRKIREYNILLSEGRVDALKAKAAEENPDNREARNAHLTRLMGKECKISFNLLCHSMGNYVLKYALIPSGTGARELAFDNVALVAADTNNDGHEIWLRHLPYRNRTYVVINEDDYALQWSRRKPGREQWPRLGHYLKNLRAENVHYLNVTGAAHLNNEHTYFLGKPVEKNGRLDDMFAGIFQGQSVERAMVYHDDINAYEPTRR